MSDSTAVDLVTPEIVSAAGPLRMALRPEEAKAWIVAIDEVRRAVLQQGSDYDVIPGTQKPSLYKPGAEKLLLVTGLGFTMERVDDEQSRSMAGVTYRCTIHRGTRDNIVAQCDGYAGYDEDRFFTSDEAAAAKERALSAQYERAPRPLKMIGYKAPWNSVAKMSQKRALVGAVLNATATSGLFTQDLEDEPRGLWDPGQAVLPQIHLLSDDERKSLTAWRKAEGLPGLAELTAEQGVAVGVQIGLLMATRQVEALKAEMAAQVQSPSFTLVEGADEPTEASGAKLDEALAAATPEGDLRAEVTARVNKTNAAQVAFELDQLGFSADQWANLTERRAALVEAILAEERSDAEERAAAAALEDDLPEG